MLFEQGRASSVRWPKKLCDEVVASFAKGPNETEGKRYLASKNWTVGMQETFFNACKKIPIRFFIVDDSGSMVTNDGCRIIRSGGGGAGGGEKAKIIKCTRWAELTDSLRFHAELSHACGAPSEFRLLNGADPVMIGLAADGTISDSTEGLEFANEVFSEQPAGQTPLCEHVRCVVRAIEALAPALRAQGKRAAVIIATDGESSDGNITDALRPLQGLPAWVVLRLCTNESKVVDYWNNIDMELELEMDVIDDLVEDAQQVKKVNPWLNYGDELHRLREFGASFKEMDLIDESALGSEQMCALISTMFSVTLPHPEVDWDAFKKAVEKGNASNGKVFSPLTGRFEPVINIAELHRTYGGDNSGSSGGSSACHVM